jgi:acetyl esterase/lipase
VSQSISVLRDLTYSVVEGVRLAADLYLPETRTPPPTVIYIHGGGWAVGSRRDHCDTRLSAIAAAGLAVLSIDYRLVDKAHFPAQVHDVKAAVRWIRGNAGVFGVDADRVGVWGASAGAVLAALVGLTVGQRDWEGGDNTNSEFTSDVHAVVFWFGISDFTATTSRSALESELVPDGPEAAFLGLSSAAEIVDQLKLARRASPVSWVHAEAPPFLIAHGDRDRIVPQSESGALHAALTRVGAESTLVTIGGAGHEDEAFDSAANIAITAGFLGARLKRATRAT